MSTEVISVPEISREAPRPHSKAGAARSTVPSKRRGLPTGRIVELAGRAAMSYRLVAGIVVLTTAAILLAGAALADPNQDARFMALLNEQGIPAIKNTPTLFVVAHRVCRELDGGMPVNDVVDEMREKSFNAYPVERLYPPDRVRRTETRFIIAAVQAYCPNDQSKVVSLMANLVSGSNQPTHPVAAHEHNAVNRGSDSPKPPSALAMITMAAGGYARSDHDTHVEMLAPLIPAVPAGEIVPNPPQIPAPPSAAQIETPPPPIAAPPARQQPPPAPQQVQAPAAPQPGGAAGSGGNGGAGGTGGDGTGGNGAGRSMEPPMPPGFVRLAP